MSRHHRFRLVGLLLAITSIAGLSIGLALPAQAGGGSIYYCYPFNYGEVSTCTTIINAPVGGVRVMDRVTGGIATWTNGTSVILESWALDGGEPGQCGAHGDPYVWRVDWLAGGSEHWAVIGDYYLNTGAVSHWNGWPDDLGILDPGGHLGDKAHYAGVAFGPCNAFNPPRWPIALYINAIAAER